MCPLVPGTYLCPGPRPQVRRRDSSRSRKDELAPHRQRSRHFSFSNVSDGGPDNVPTLLHCTHMTNNNDVLFTEGSNSTRPTLLDRRFDRVDKRHTLQFRSGRFHRVDAVERGCCVTLRRSSPSFICEGVSRGSGSFRGSRDVNVRRSGVITGYLRRTPLFWSGNDQRQHTFPFVLRGPSVKIKQTLTTQYDKPS